mmetsp:Transcript_5876/g.18716  ORF Transcript_5876/g.18716 Transcript_5876/m.18716 type:complete len:120 (-) Transcript_5876:124-483(-)
MLLQLPPFRLSASSLCSFGSLTSFAFSSFTHLTSRCMLSISFGLRNALLVQRLMSHTRSHALYLSIHSSLALLLRFRSCLLEVAVQPSQQLDTLTHPPLTRLAHFLPCRAHRCPPSLMT